MSDSGGSGPLTLAEAMAEFWLLSRLRLESEWDLQFKDGGGTWQDSSTNVTEDNSYYIAQGTSGPGSTKPKDRRCNDILIHADPDTNNDYVDFDETIFKWSDGVGYRIDFGSNSVKFVIARSSGDYEITWEFPAQGSGGYDDYHTASLDLLGGQDIALGLVNLGATEYRLNNIDLTATEYYYENP